MLPSVLRATLGRRRIRLVRARTQFYEKELPRDEIERFQVDRFNEIWSDALERVPFYRSWATEHDLPDVIQDLSDLHHFPPLTKAVMVERAKEIFTNAQGEKLDSAYVTGGTSGTPTRFPRGSKEGADRYANAYVPRSWWGIRPFDSYVHVWGHAHLVGGGRLSKLKRRVQAFLVNATRVSAYQLSEDALASHAQSIIDRDPKYLLGYTSAIFRIARYSESIGLDTSKLTKLKAVLVTAETVTTADVEAIRRVFGVPVVIEYGAAETGVVAYSRKDSWPLQVLWRSFIVRVTEESGLSITTLDDRLFPLVNYTIGDTAEGGDVVEGNAITLGAITGRAQDVVTVSTTNGECLQLSAMLPFRILKTRPGLTAVQYHQEAPGRLRILLTAMHELDLPEIAHQFGSSVLRGHPEFDTSSVVFEQVSEPRLTKAGKQALFV